MAQFAYFAKADASEAARQKDVMDAERKLGSVQYSAGNLVAALTSFSRALKIAEALPASPEQRRAVAACNFEMGEVLAASHRPEVAATNLGKALGMYRELAGSQDKRRSDKGSDAGGF